MHVGAVPRAFPTWFLNLFAVAVHDMLMFYLCKHILMLIYFFYFLCVPRTTTMPYLTVYAIENCNWMINMINYADDTKIYLSHSEPQVVEGGINRDLESARLWFKENGMMPNPKKYQAIVLGSKGCDINFQCANETIPTSNEINLLGVMLDSKLKFDAHVASVCRNP